MVRQIKVAACQPVVLNPTEARMEELTGIKLVPYKDSTLMDCPACGRAMWVGPEHMKAMKADPKIMPRCYTCAVEIARQGEATVIPLSKKRFGE